MNKLGKANNLHEKQLEERIVGDNITISDIDPIGNQKLERYDSLLNAGRVFHWFDSQRDKIYNQIESLREWHPGYRITKEDAIMSKLSVELYKTNIREFSDAIKLYLKQFLVKANEAKPILPLHGCIEKIALDKKQYITDMMKGFGKSEESAQNVYELAKGAHVDQIKTLIQNFSKALSNNQNPDKAIDTAIYQTHHQTYYA